MPIVTDLENQGNDSRLLNLRKFSWDIKNVPKTDGRGDQESKLKMLGYGKDFMIFPTINSNKIIVKLQRITLEPQFLVVRPVW